MPRRQVGAAARDGAQGYPDNPGDVLDDGGRMSRLTRIPTAASTSAAPIHLGGGLHRSLSVGLGAAVTRVYRLEPGPGR